MLAFKKKLTRDYRVKLHPDTFQKYQLFFLILRKGVYPPLFIFEVHVWILPILHVYALRLPV
jgi:hypothetical protein